MFNLTTSILLPSQHPQTHSPKSAEYKSAMAVITPLVEQHHSTMKPGEPQLNYCDRAVMVSQFCVMSLWTAFTVTDGDCLQWDVRPNVSGSIHTDRLFAHTHKIVLCNILLPA